MEKKKAKKKDSLWWMAGINKSGVAHLSKASKAELMDELEDAVMRICEGYEVE